MCDFYEVWDKGSKARVRDDPLLITQAPRSSQADLSASKLSLHSLDPQNLSRAAINPKSKAILTVKDKTGDDKLELDELATINKLRRNQTIIDFCCSDIKEKKNFSGKSSILMSNFSFLIKMSLMQVFFVGLSSFPVICLIGLLILEVVYMGSNLFCYIKYCHLKSFLMIIPKITQSIFLLLIESLMLNSYLRLVDNNFPLPENTQNSLSTLFMVSNFVEYAVLLLTIVMIVRMFCQEKSRKQVDPNYKVYIEEKDSFLIYKKPILQEEAGDKEAEKPAEPVQPVNGPLLPVPLIRRRIKMPLRKR